MSNKTKERILSTALTLFNEKGLSQVPTRAISEHLHISQGHLTYYFHKRTDILNTLFSHYEDQFTILLDTPVENVDKYDFFAWLKALLEINYTFRFLFLDFAQVMRESPVFKQTYLKLRHLRKQKFMEFMNLLSPNGDDFSLVYQQVELILEFGMLYDIMEKPENNLQILAKLESDLRSIFA